MSTQETESFRRNFEFARRVVVKIGTSILRRADTGVDRACLRALAAQIAAIRQGPPRRQVVLISSGAVGFGMMHLGLSRRPSDVASLQATAAVGQPKLMQAWTDAFESHDVTVSQLLLTNDGLQDRHRYLNAKNALTRVLDLGVVPIVNENDTVAVEELTFGDNDKLSALVAAMLDADLLVILTDVDGFYDPADSGAGRRVIRTVRSIRPEWIPAAARPNRSGRRGFTIGGISAKLKAAQVALSSGVPVVIANGRTKDVLKSVLAGDPAGTLFLPSERALKGKKIWLSFFPASAGEIVVDRGAAAALTKNGKSLLASGIVRVVGTFPRNGCVSVTTEDGREIARGISFYSAEEVAAIAGNPSSAIRSRLHLSDKDDAPAEVIHRDDLAVMK